MATEEGPPDAPSTGDGSPGSDEEWPPRVRYREPLPVTLGTWDPDQAAPSGRGRRADRADYRRWRRGPRPPWWPHDEPWPPSGSRRPPWVFGCLFFLVFLLFLGFV